MALLDGRVVSARILEKVRFQVGQLSTLGIRPGLATILVGDDPASRVYVNNKKKVCSTVGIYSREIHLSDTVTQTELERVIQDLNEDVEVSGILLQLPLPNHLNAVHALELIRPDKDVDCFHPMNVGRLMQGAPIFLPCTPAGVMELLRSVGLEDLSGKHCVVVGRSNIVGKPMSMLLLQHNGTVTVCHSRTTDLEQITQQADILVSAVGKAGLITGEMIRPGAVVIDVGTNRNEAGKLCGDIDFASVESIASYITPVPGGVGPMTVAMLMCNTVTAARVQNGMDLS